MESSSVNSPKRLVKPFISSSAIEVRDPSLESPDTWGPITPATAEFIEALKRSKQGVPAGEFRHDLTEEELDMLVVQTLGSEYVVLKKVQGGSTRNVYRVAMRNKNGTINLRKTFMAKVDKPESMLTSENAKENYKKGWNTSNDLEAMMAIRDPEKYHLASIARFFTPRISTGEEVAIVLERDFAHSRTLNEEIRKRTEDRKTFERKSLTTGEFYQVFSQLCYALKHLVEDEGRFHRDLKPTNILIRESQTQPVKGDRVLEVMVTDLATSCSIDAISKKPVPSTGGKSITNPFLFERFTGRLEEYGVRSEIYSVGMNMYFSKTGDFPIDSNDLEGRAIARINGRIIDLLDKNGRIDVEKFKQVVKETKTVEGIASEEGEIIEKCLLAPLGEGYRSLEELRADLEKLNPDYKTVSRLEKKSGRWKYAAVALALIGTGFLVNQANQADKQEKRLKSAIELNSFMSGSQQVLEEANNYEDKVEQVAKEALRLELKGKDAIIAAQEGLIQRQKIVGDLQLEPLPALQDFQRTFTNGLYAYITDLYSRSKNPELEPLVSIGQRIISEGAELENQLRNVNPKFDSSIVGKLSNRSERFYEEVRRFGEAYKSLNTETRTLIESRALAVDESKTHN